jgi:plasmid stabilization system protein ParE
MKKSVLSPCALCDADDAMRWYDSSEPGLGSEFVRALEECLSRIEANPELYRVFHPPYRKALMRRFPFQVVYEVREDCLWILAVYHAKRDPGHLRRRMGGH